MGFKITPALEFRQGKGSGHIDYRGVPGVYGVYGNFGVDTDGSKQFAGHFGSPPLQH